MIGIFLIYTWIYNLNYFLGEYPIVKYFWIIDLNEDIAIDNHILFHNESVMKVWLKIGWNISLEECDSENYLVE